MSHVDPVTPQVSLIVPVYNCERYLSHQLDALLADSAMRMEVIAVDDGSRDGSMAILQAYGARDARLRVIGRRHVGQGAARNAGLQAARGVGDLRRLAKAHWRLRRMARADDPVTAAGSP